MYGPCIYIIEKLRFRTQTAANKNKTREYLILIVDSLVLQDRDLSNILGSELRVINAFYFSSHDLMAGGIFVVIDQLLSECLNTKLQKKTAYLLVLKIKKQHIS